MELTRSEWTKESYNQLIKELKEGREEEYASFHKGLIPVEERILGIRIPMLRAMAKEIGKGNPLSYLKQAGHYYNEENILCGAVIGQLKEKEVGWERILEEIRAFIPYITNWSVCDTFCSSLKVTKNHKQEMFSFLQQYAKSRKEYEARFAFVMYLGYFMEEEYMEEIFRLCDECTLTDYYVQMAIAWLISVAYVKCKTETKAYLANNRLDDFTYNKSLQKIIESNRVTKEEKAIIRQRKRK